MDDIRTSVFCDDIKATLFNGCGVSVRHNAGV